MSQGLPGAALCLLLSVVLSGCVSGDEGLHADPGDPVLPAVGHCVAGEESMPESGVVRGVVSTDLFEPLSGVTLILMDESRSDPVSETTSDDQGEFDFCNIPPGRYVVQALHTGFETSLRGVDVGGGDVARVAFQLVRLPSLDPYVVEIDIVGVINWGVWYQIEVPGHGCRIETEYGNVTTCDGRRSAHSENIRNDFEDVDNLTQTVHIELVWSPAGVLGENLQLIAFCPEAETQPGWSDQKDHPCHYHPEHMTSPVVVRADRHEWNAGGVDPSGKWWIHIFPGYGLLGTYPLTGVDVGAAYEQEFKIYLSVFQREGAPEGFSRAPAG